MMYNYNIIIGASIEVLYSSERITNTLNSKNSNY